MAFSPDGKILAVASEAQSVKLYDFPSGREKASLKGDLFRFHCLTFSRSGKFVAAGGGDWKQKGIAQVNFWEVATGKQVLDFKEHTLPVLAVAFGSSDQTVATASADQTVHSFGTKPSRWLLRKALFRQDGAPHTLLLLADVSQPLQEEEQIAWKRLIRVLGHELSNSLAPIKSIAGSLLARAESIGGDDATIRDFRRGLSVVESRADALHRFVQSYRLLAQLQPPHFKPVQTGPLLERVALLEQRVSVRLDPGPPPSRPVQPRRDLPPRRDAERHARAARSGVRARAPVRRRCKS